MMLIQVAPGQSLQTVIDALPADNQPVTIHLACFPYKLFHRHPIYLSANILSKILVLY